MSSEQQNKQDSERKKKGIIVTISIHLLLIACFILFGFKTADKAQSIYISLEQSEIMANEPPTTPQQKAIAKSNKVDNAKDILTDNSSKVPTRTSLKTIETESSNNNTTEVSKGLLNTAAIYKSRPKTSNYINPSNNSKGTYGFSDKGDDLTGKYDIFGRRAIHLETQKNNCGESGTVVLKKIVNQNGIVTEALHVDGTTSNTCLINQAKVFAKQITYAPSMSGKSKMNEGRITIKGSLN
jgi:hypothetical protein